MTAPSARLVSHSDKPTCSLHQNKRVSTEPRTLVYLSFPIFSSLQQARPKNHTKNPKRATKKENLPNSETKSRPTMKLCCACAKENSRYKCPTCLQPYCSAVCCKSHKEAGCERPEPEPSEGDASRASGMYDFPTEDTVQPEKLALLRGSEDVKECLKNPHVRDIVAAILNNPDPTEAIGLAMTEPIFVELADACLRSVEPPDAEKPA